MVILLTLSVVDCGFKPRSGQTKDYKIGICCFSNNIVIQKAKHIGLILNGHHNQHVLAMI